jgi:hypothetical protein
MSPASLVGVVFLACDVLEAKAEVFHLVPAMTVSELAFSVESRTIVEHLGKIGCAVGFEVCLGDFECFVAGHLRSPF